MPFSSLPGDFAEKQDGILSVIPTNSDSTAESSDQHQDHKHQHDRIEDEQNHGCWTHEAHDKVCGASICKALESFGVRLRSGLEVFQRWCIGVEVPARGI